MISWRDGTFTADDWSVWQRGYAAALDGVQECPCAEGTREHDIWYDGFGEGTEDFINYNRI